MLIKGYLERVISRFSALADIHVDSQVKQFLNTAKPAFDDAHGTYVFNDEQLSYDMNPTSWKLHATTTTLDHILNFVTFIPQPENSPLAINTHSGIGCI